MALTSKKNKPLNGKTVYFNEVFLKPANDNQIQMMKSIEENILTLAYGVAGSGKSTLAIYMGIKALLSGKYRKLIIMKPPVEAGRSLGYLPGDQYAKQEPFLESIMDIIEDFGIPSHVVEELVIEGKIEIGVLQYSRGKNFNKCFVIVDESQNLDSDSWFLILSRLADDSKLVMVGDSFQTDVKNSGLEDGIKKLEGIENIGMIRFRPEDCMRGEFVKSVIRAYGRY